MRDTHVWHAIEHLHKCFYYAKAYGVDKQVFDSFDEWCLEK